MKGIFSMSNVLIKITQSACFKKKDGISYINAVVLMGLFTFLFLNAEYLFVDVLSRMVSEDKTVLAQNYALGVSAAGFLLYPLLNRFCKNRLKTVCFAVFSLASVLCIAFICMGTAYTATFIAGLVLFLLLGLFGSAVFYVSMRMMKTDRYLARTVGISYALGILLQFANNNLVRSETAEAIILSIFLLLLVWMLIKNDRVYCEDKAEASSDEEKSESNTGEHTKGSIVGILMILLVVLMTFIFSTLDSAVTLVHANGTVDIGQWPRILLALSGLAAGFVFDIKNRKYMGLVMYCVMVLSTICIVVLKLAGPFLVGLIVFYLSAGFFAVFFTSSFMELSSHMKIPELWAGMGRRFIGILIEHFAGKFPLWLSPVQVKILTISDKFIGYAKSVEDSLKNEGLRCELDARAEKIGYKIRSARMERIPYILVVGEKEAEDNNVSVRKRDNGDLGSMPISQLLAILHEEGI